MHISYKMTISDVLLTVPKMKKTDGQHLESLSYVINSWTIFFSCIIMQQVTSSISITFRIDECWPIILNLIASVFYDWLAFQQNWQNWRPVHIWEEYERSWEFCSRSNCLCSDFLLKGRYLCWVWWGPRVWILFPRYCKPLQKANPRASML